MNRRPSLIPTCRLLRWFFTHRVYRYLRMPLCAVCRDCEATVRLGRGVWICTNHPLFVSATQYGIRPPWGLTIRTKRGVDKLFGLDVKIGLTPFWQSKERGRE